MEKSYRKYLPKAIPRPLFNFAKYPQNSHCMQETVFKIRYFEKGLAKCL